MSLYPLPRLDFNIHHTTEIWVSPKRIKGIVAVADYVLALLDRLAASLTVGNEMISISSLKQQEFRNVGKGGVYNDPGDTPIGGAMSASPMPVDDLLTDFPNREFGSQASSPSETLCSPSHDSSRGLDSPDSPDSPETQEPTDPQSELLLLQDELIEAQKRCEEPR